MKKILLITDFSKPWNNGWYYKRGFEKNGCQVFPLSPHELGEDEQQVFDVLDRFRPDMVLHTKDELPVEVFSHLRRKVPLVQWYPDPVIPDWLPPYVRECDLFLTMAEGLLGEFRKMNQKSFWLTQAFEPDFFVIGDITKEDRSTFSSDVTFVGNLGSKPQYLLRRRYLKRIIKEGYQLKWWGPKIPLKVNTIAVVMGALGRAYGGKFIWGSGYAKVARLSKIFLAFDSMPHIRKSMSARMYTALGCGAFYMCQYVEGIEDLLEPDREIVTFMNEDEMVEKIRYFLDNESVRREIAERGRKRVLREHTYEVRIRQLLDIVSQHI